MYTLNETIPDLIADKFKEIASSTKYLNERIKPGESTQVFTGFILL